MNLTDIITELSIPRIVIAGIQSGCGKTTVARGLMATLIKRGFVVQPYKIGPDFIDPSHHTTICNRPSRNLDLIMTGEEGIMDSFLKGSHGADIAVIEGVMGMYDGLDGTTFGSTAHVAKILKAPVILVIPVEGMSTSVHAIISGFRYYEPEINLAGVILNRINSKRHREMVKLKADLPQLGYLPYDTSFYTESRHLGLIMGDEKKIEDPVSLIEENCDIQEIIKIASSSPSLTINSSISPSPEISVNIGIARDTAFCFYYQHNLDILKENGACLHFFSPIQDPLPEVEALYLGGGYPELYAENLEHGKAKEQIRSASENDLPILGECGGLLYLSSGLTKDKTYKWVNILPGEAEMCDRFQALGYNEGITTGGTSFTKKAYPVHGHEFHYSKLNIGRDPKFSIQLNRGQGIENGKDGLYLYETVGTYTHSWFSKKFCTEFILAAQRFSRK
jgi:cobyrinic acid a,c-diamide synthase